MKYCRKRATCRFFTETFVCTEPCYSYNCFRGKFITTQKREPLSDMDLPIANRTQANLWKSRFFELHRELRKTNKALRKKSRQIKKLKEKP